MVERTRASCDNHKKAAFFSSFSLQPFKENEVGVRGRDPAVLLLILQGKNFQLPPNSRDRPAAAETASIRVVRKPFFSRILTPVIAVPPGEQT